MTMPIKLTLTAVVLMAAVALLLTYVVLPAVESLQVMAGTVAQ